MDHVPKAWRGRWNALEGLTMFCYSGSAMAGGFLIERYGYRFCFFVTSLIFLAGLMLELLLLPIIRNERKLKVTTQVATYFQRIEHNVWLAYVYTLFFWSCRSILLDQVLAGYVFVLTGSNEPVGLVTGINGLVRLFMAIPGGYASDRFRRDTVLKAAGVLGLGCVALSMTSYLMGHMPLLYVTYGCWGAYFALQRPAMEAIFADSVPQGEREVPFTIRYMLMNLSGMVGPLASVIFFLFYGDSWSLSGLQWVLCGGLVIGTPGIVSLFFFNDDLAYENIKPAHQPSSPTTGLTTPSSRKVRALSYVEDNGDLCQLDEIQDGHRSEQGEKTRLVVSSPGLLSVILFCTDFIMFNGSGLSIVFLPLFLQNDYGLTPSSINLLVLVQQVLVLVTTPLARLVSKTSIMRSSLPLRSSILMDHVAKEWRGRWNALESLTMFCFCGTSVVGGYLVEAYGYRYCFFVTSVVWFVGLSVELVLVPIIRNERTLRKATTSHKLVMLA
ncbi:hypothetical protein DYB35_009667 [Aphanomyces astaci]|uniref:Major facilitator superfamily (MFS) profile domain-containing protein n=1 Tax=Aphanomyces astaci TaxID=112090 RepID=A0A418CMS1_APHAT|nr:hypothetical protein DYB35_009667 [Aphanomyces astaci]